MSEDESVKDLNDNSIDFNTNNNDIKPEAQYQASSPIKPRLTFVKLFRILCVVGFLLFTILFINEAVIQPYKIKKSVDFTRSLYYSNVAVTPSASPTRLPDETAIAVENTSDSTAVSASITAAATSIPEAVDALPTPAPLRDMQGRLLSFYRLLAQNDDVKGWLTIADINIDYVVMQSDSAEPDFYLDKDINKAYSKAGSLYLDYKSSVEKSSQNLVIYGHNMQTTTEKMFHRLLEYKPKKKDNNIDFYRSHPVISFDTIYETGTWKIFSVFITTPDVSQDYFFDYRKSTFANASDFLNFVYQLRIRSLLNINTVDIREDDELLTLSTCSYEVDRKDMHYRTVIVARKVREGESSDVDVNSVTINETPLYADDYYYYNGGEAPELPATFEEALANGYIDWYTSPKDNK